MSNRLTFSLASLILIFVAGFALLIPSTAEAADPTFNGTIANIELTVGDTYQVFLPTATDPDDPTGNITYTVTQKTTSGDDADPLLADISFAFDATTRAFTSAGATLTNNLTGATGTYVYTATDSSSPTEDATLEFTITVNSSVTIAGTVVDQKLKAGRAFELRLPMATDSANGTIAYTLAPDISSGIAGLSFNADLRYITGTPTDATAVAEAEYTYTASTGTAAAEIKFKIEVVVDTDPVFGPASVGDITGTVGTAIERLILPTATDADGDDITHTLTPDLPAGLTFDDELFIIEGTPTEEMAETEYTWAATDADGLMTGGTAAEKKFNITINAVPVPVAFAAGASIADQAFVVGTFKGIVLPPAAADTGTGALTYSLTPALPAGLTFDAATRTLSGNATAAAAAAEYTYKVADSATPATEATLTFMITVTDPAAPVAVALTTTIDDQTYTAGTAITDLVLPAADANTGTAPLMYSLAPAIGNGLMFDAATRTISGTPTAAMAATEYTYTVTDSAATPTTASQMFMITVEAAAVVVDDDPISQPTNVMAMPQNDGSIMVTWKWAGADATETAALAGFTVMWNPSMDVAADQTSYTIPAHLLTAGEDTTVSVLARATAGSGFATPAAGTAIATPVQPIDPNALRFAPGTTLDDMTFTAGTAIGTTAMPYIQLPQAYGGPTGVYTYSLLKGIGKVDVTDGDNGLSVDRTNLRLMGTPMAAAASTLYTWRVTDAQAHGDIEAAIELEFNITVNEAANRAPVYPATALTITGVVGTAITAADASATDADGDDLTYSWDVDEAALGLALNTSTGMITGTPLKVHTGTHPVTASDGKLSAMRDVTITITAVADTTSPTVEITVLSKDANGKHTLDADGNVRFDLLFSEPLAKAPSISRLQAADFFVTRNGRIMLIPETALSAAMATTMPATTGAGNKERYILTIPAGANPQEIQIELLGLGVLGGQVADPSGNALVQLGAISKFDTVPPDVSISVRGANSVSGTPFTFTGEPMAKLTFQFNFTEPLSPAFTTTDIHRSVGGDNFRLLADSDPRPVPGVRNAYTVVVTVIDINQPTTVLIKRLEIADAAKNLLQNDRYATYAPATSAPVASVRATGPFNCGIDGNPVTVTITDSEALGSGQAIAASEITVSTGWQIRTGSFRASTTAKVATANFSVVRKDVENASDRSWLGVTTVTITVAADAVKDDTNRGNAAASQTYTAGPVITVPAGQFVVVIRGSAWGRSHLNAVRTLFLGDYNVRADNIQVQPWDCMPDLGLIFDTTVDASPGIGGGGLMVLQSPDHTGAAISKGSVGISEIMWSEDRGIPFGRTSNLEHAREQWIELHNTNNFDVKVTLFELIREEAYRAPTGNHATVISNPPGLVDVMANYDIGGRWTVKGQDGNSELGTDFISMQRHKNGNKYDHGDNNGRNAGKWTPSTAIYLTRRANLANTGQVPLEDLNYHFIGTPGRSHSFTAPGPRVRTAIPNGQKPDGSRVIFNEIANRRDQTLEWIELKNISDKDVDLRNYEITIVTGVDQEARFFHFNYGDNHVIIPAGGLLLLVDTDPRYNDDHPIAVGHNVRGGNDQVLGIGADAPRYLVTDFAEGGLPDNGEFMLILRSNKGEDYENKKGTQDRVVDIIGYHPNLVKQTDPHYTNLWPLRVFGAPHIHNKIELEKVHDRQHEIDPDKATHGDKKPEHLALRDVGYTGVGYKRHAQRIPANGGSPGYEHGTSKGLAADISSTGAVTISEIMFDQGDSRYPQWIELYNSSDSPVDLHAGDHGWRLVVENFDDGEIPINRLSGTLNFRSSDVKTILPKQTVIVASTRARNSGSAFFDTAVVFPPTRVFAVWDDARGELDMKRSTDPILSTEGFYIELIDGKNNLSDSVGNLIRSPNRRVAAQIEWPLSAITGEMMEGRSSILRRYNEYKDGKLVGRYTEAQIATMGITAEGWISAHKTEFREVRETWFGHPDDYGTPGITSGRVLPVSLSKFRPERLDDGTIVVRWITESETNNAGFNILRSVDRKGEFTKLNTQLIAGKGTTSERTDYQFVDKSAKPNVIYYYQIQDVSLDGKVSTLQVTHLRGHVSAAGKATTTWGELKALQ